MNAPLRYLDPELLRALTAIADCGSFSAAAAQLGRTQSAVSLQIKRLEDNLGQTLLERSQGRVVGPTAEGTVLLDYARRILRLNDEAYSCFSQQPLAGRLRLGLPEELMEQVFPQVHGEFSRDYPRIELSVRCDLSARLAALLETGELDLAIAKRVIGAGWGEENKDGGWQLLRREPAIWCGSRTVTQRPLPLAVFHEGCAFRMAAIAALATQGIPWRAAFVGNSFVTLRQAVAAGLAITALPRSLALGLPEWQGEEELPPLPEVELVARLGPGEVAPAARRLLQMFAARL